MFILIIKCLTFILPTGEEVLCVAPVRRGNKGDVPLEVGYAYSYLL